MDDEALLARARRGDDAAFSRLVERHQGVVRGFLRRACGDAGLADDMAQEAFVTAWMTLGRFDARSSFRAWVCGIAYRKHLTSRRAARRSLQRDTAYAETRGLEGGEGTGEEDRIAVMNALAGLPEDQRAAVALCLAGDFSHAEAASALNAPLGTIKSHVARGRAKMLEVLEVRDDR